MGPKKVKEVLPAADIKRLKSALKNKAGQAGVDELANGTSEEKREILNKFAEDRTLSWRFELAQKTSLSREESSAVKGRWLTRKQIAMKEGMELNDPHLDIVLKGLPERDHENPLLAQEGVKQFRLEISKDKIAKKQSESTEVTNAAAGMDRLKKAPASGSKALPAAAGVPTSYGGIQVNWTTAMKGMRTTAANSLKEACGLIASSQKHRSGIENASDKVALREGQRILQEAVEAIEDIQAASQDTQEDHKRLLETSQQLTESIGCFRDLLHHVAPKSKPVEKDNN
eukprot:s2754_g18.t1